MTRVYLRKSGKQTVRSLSPSTMWLCSWECLSTNQEQTFTKKLTILTPFILPLVFRTVRCRILLFLSHLSMLLCYSSKNYNNDSLYFIVDSITHVSHFPVSLPIHPGLYHIVMCPWGMHICTYVLWLRQLHLRFITFIGIPRISR